MNEEKTKEQDGGVELEFDLGDPPQKVWRAISIPEFRERWLPKEALADPDAITVTPGQEVRYRLRDDSPPFLESTVTFILEIPDELAAQLDELAKLCTQADEARNGGTTHGPLSVPEFCCEPDFSYIANRGITERLENSL